MRISALEVFLSVSALGATLAHGASSVTLAWDPSPNVNVTGYRLYYGPASRNYTDMIPVGPSATANISSLAEGTTYYFAVTAVDGLGLESDYSKEISYTMPSTRPKLQMLLPPTGQVVLRITGQPGHTYEIQATRNLTSWETVGVVGLRSRVTLDFTDPTATGQPVRFYRLRQIQ